MKVASLVLGIAAFSVMSAPIALAQSANGPSLGTVTLVTIGEESAPLVRFAAPTLEGQVAGEKQLGNPKIGEATVVFNVSQGGALLAWVETVWNKQCVEKDTTVRVADHDYNIKRGVMMSGSVIASIEWPTLKDSDARSFDVTAKWQPENLKYEAGGGKAQGVMGTKARQMLPSNFIVNMPGISDDWITSIGLPKITPKIAKESHGRAANGAPFYESVEYSSIKIEIGAAGYKTAEDLAIRILQDGYCDESEFIDILIDMKDQTMKETLGTFTLLGCALKSFTSAPSPEAGKEATATMEFLVEDFRFAVSHK
jgi:hypothetical protein